jgi:hypothetical protein
MLPIMWSAGLTGNSNLNPGGYLELQDIDFPILCDDDGMLAAAGFVDIQEILFKWPMNR